MLKSLRVLREFVRVAWRDHTCNLCGQMIGVGEEYECSIEVKVYDPPRAGRRKFFHVGKYHYPDCPWDFYEEAEEFCRDDEAEETSKEESDEELPLAA